VARVKSSRGPLPSERRRLIAELLNERGSVSVAALEEDFGISSMTARRDLDELERQGIARRTHGGAVLPGTSLQEDSFARRLEIAAEAKERLAAAAMAELSAAQTIFLDCSTTAFFVARRIVDANLRCTVVTNAEPVMHLISQSETGRVELIGVGGRLRKLTQSASRRTTATWCCSPCGP
jgi:DeoR/GlpR family transcriptional regulator of sugar metabolism